MVAGLLLGLENKKSPEDILKLAMACAASSISREGTGLVNEQARVPAGGFRIGHRNIGEARSFLEKTENGQES